MEARAFFMVTLAFIIIGWVVGPQVNCWRLLCLKCCAPLLVQHEMVCLGYHFLCRGQSALRFYPFQERHNIEKFSEMIHSGVAMVPSECLGVLLPLKFHP